ncbi:ubiquitin carboxyl-terminal hydrolase 48 isoform X3 [Polypterus senegalus]|uniref:ubiquitin carboxyl-terminal hydrolase 48 isoform X3 n=1 Tax=Polypterus senegalus TaxID=55291 RepID=UPI001964FD14|nr:ubiquitin carboxyl-terminal hydrolase 48 isoform X3 [Polypterus senegalus]
MAPRLQLERAAWRWVESVRPEDVTAENIETAYRVLLEGCKRGACRRNCKGNPNCLVGIGEHIWLGEIDENTFHNIDDPNSERRNKVWFHNLDMRRAIYLCQNSRAEELAVDDDTDYEPQEICEHLQYLFALLQNSNRRYIDPSGLVKALGLDTGQQQDAQEFSKLFLSLLEDTLSKQKNPNVQNIIQQQFCGQCAYITVCNHCGRESQLLSRFYELELNIQGHKQLSDCVTEFLKEEKLEGDNRYFCENCQSKQNATREIRLLNLPHTLNFQLMRFVFDRQTGHKKKLNTYIGFPEILDMGPFLDKKDEKCVYELNAVLIHRGVSAYSGHYIAHLRDGRTNDWYKFNDEEIEKMEGKKLQLGSEEDIEPSKSQTRKPKCIKGYHSSRNAYMLVYKRQVEEVSHSEPNVQVPDFLQRLVDRDNRKFEEWCHEMAEMRKQSVDKGKAKHEEVKEIYELLPAGDGQAFEFIPLEWLRKWLDDSTVTKPIDNSKFSCCHGKLHPDKIEDVKRISQKAADIFFNRYGGGPRLDNSSLCRECVVERCRVLRLKNQLNEDYKVISNMVKIVNNSNQGYWIGKASLRSWRQLALEQLEEEDDELKHANGKANGESISVLDVGGAGDTKDNDDENLNFNEDILCSHGGLCTSENERKLVSNDVWNRLKTYFPKAPEFPASQESCPKCKTLERECEESEALNKMIANDQKMALLNLFQDKNRPSLQKWPTETDHLYIVSLFFVEEWKKFIRRPGRCTPVSSVANGALLCPHGGLMFTYESMSKGDAKHVAVLWPSEWEIINRFFLVDQTIKLSRTTDKPQQDALHIEFQTDPDLCLECREGLLFQQQRDLREYTQATVYIRKIVDNTKIMKDAAPELNVSGSEAEDEREVKIGDNDPDFNQINNGAKRQKLSVPSSGSGTLSSSFISHQKQGIRRSTRHRKVRGEKALIVSANQTLKELKIQIMHAFSVAPFDQNLSVDGRCLTEDSATLGSLGVVPESVIFLKADEPIADYSAMDDVLQVCMPEEGFKGTGLLGH